MQIAEIIINRGDLEGAFSEHSGEALVLGSKTSIFLPALPQCLLNLGNEASGVGQSRRILSLGLHMRDLYKPRLACSSIPSDFGDSVSNLWS